MAKPILASTLFQIAKDSKSTEKSRRVAIGVGNLDETLNGGAKSGRITCISGERGTGKTLIGLYLLVTHLLSNVTSQAAIIDTTGSFSVLRLHQIIISRLKSKRHAQGATTSGLTSLIPFNRNDATHDLDALASQVLDRVKIMRVFDFVGLSEAINELRDEIRTGAEQNDPIARKTYVPDSQADAEDEDIMLFDGANEDGSGKPRLESVGLIIVDNITSVANPMLKSDYVQGQALLTTFMRSLQLFTKDSSLVTVLLNNAASPRQSYPSFPGLVTLNNSATMPPSTYIADPLTPLGSRFHEQPSIFASTTARPSLGKTFAALTDHHILLSTVPKRRRDAEIIVGGKSGKAETVNVIEILRERGHGSGGQWAVFEISEAGTHLKTPS